MKKLQGTIAGLVIAVALCAQPASAMRFECFQRYAKDVETCASISTWGWRTLCGLDAAAGLAHCVRSGNKGL